MPLKKSDLYSNLWRSCDALRGGMDASQYKDYILSLLFLKYVSDVYAGDPNSIFTIPKGYSFADIRELKGTKEIGEKITAALSKIAEENDLRNVIDLVDFNDEEKLGEGKELVDKLTTLIALFDDLDFSRNSAGGDDLLGDAYEFLMRHFATQSGKSKGQFYTPAEVSRIMAKVIRIRDVKQTSQTLYDPTCGSGALLIKAAEEAPVDISIYGQEMDVSTRALAKMNMVMHGRIMADIRQGNTLASPRFLDNGSLKRFDYAVANPPFSLKEWTSGVNVENDEFARFEFGVPPEKNGDYAFLSHMIKSLKDTGRGAIILPHGVLFRGNAEGTIRKRLIEKGYIEGIIALPANLFYGTGIPACIIVLDKADAGRRSGIFMIDASRGFRKDGAKNRLREQDIHKIVDIYNRFEPDPKYSRMVERSEIEANDFNLNIPRYIDTTAEEDIHDLGAHLHGGIPKRDVEALQAYWDVFPDLKRKLFVTDRPGYFRLKGDVNVVKSTVLSHPAFTEYRESVLKTFRKWRKKYEQELDAFKKKSHPVPLIEEMSESLLKSFGKTPLLDAYDLYQHLMDYWDETLQDDLFLISESGWKSAAALRRIIVEKKDKDDKTPKEKPDIVIGRMKYKSDLIPPELVTAWYFAEEQAGFEQTGAELEAIDQQIVEMIEEHGGEDGLLANVMDGGKVKKTLIKPRLREIKNDPDCEDEYRTLDAFEQLVLALQRQALKLATQDRDLTEKVFKKYEKLTEAEIKELLIKGKWMARLESDLSSELDRVSQQLAGRVKLLAERYASTLEEIEAELKTLSRRVAKHLEKMEVE